MALLHDPLLCSTRELRQSSFAPVNAEFVRSWSIIVMPERRIVVLATAMLAHGPAVRSQLGSHQRVCRLLAQLALVDSENVGKPVGRQFLAYGGIVMLAVIRAGLILVHKAKRDIDAL